MRLIALWVLLSATLPALAQSPATPLVGRPKVVLTESAEARSAPPSGPLNVFVGQKVTSLPKGAEVEVISRRSYGAFGGTNVWLEVQPPRTAASSSHAPPVWIYGGVQASTSVVPSGVHPTK
jgi:hypothetical protein